MAFLELRNVSHRFPSYASSGPSSFAALREVSLSFESGEFVVLAGRSGSGKTVLIRHLNGLLAPTSGTVLVQGKPIARIQSRARQLVGMVFQEPEHQIVGQTVEEDVAFGPRNLGLTAQEVSNSTTSALDMLDLTPKRFADPRTLSAGEKRRLAIAGVLAMQPRLIVCDEPFSNLDYAGVVEVLHALTTLHASGCGVIVVTHEVEKVLAHATRLVVLDRGEVVFDGDAWSGLDRFPEWGLRPQPDHSREAVRSLSWLPTAPLEGGER